MSCSQTQGTCSVKDSPTAHIWRVLVIKGLDTNKAVSGNNDLDIIPTAPEDSPSSLLVLVAP